MDNNFYQNGANHHGFIYQNPNYTTPATYRHENGKWKDFKLATIYINPQAITG